MLSKKILNDKNNTGENDKDQEMCVANTKQQHTGIISAAKAAKRTKKQSKNNQK